MTSENAAEEFRNNPEHELPPGIVTVSVRHWKYERDEEGNAKPATEIIEGTIEIHEDLADDVAGFFAEALRIGFPVQTVQRTYNRPDPELMEENVSSGYNDRFIAGSETKSQHALGRAFDVNTRLNPYVRKIDGVYVAEPENAIFDPSEPGTLGMLEGSDHPLVEFMEERGWTWGGRWDPPDYQHFEKPFPEPAESQSPEGAS